MVRLTEGGLAAIVGGADALIAGKVSQKLPGNIPAPVGFEAVVILAGLFHDKIGVSKEHGDVLAIAGLTLGGARLTRVAMSGALMKGPAAWGGDPNYALATGGAGGDADPSLAAGGGGKNVRLLAGRKAQGGASIYPAMSEAPGVAG